MKAGQKMYGKDGVQICLFPLEEMIVTQESSPSAFSHCCGHPTDLGTHSVVTPVYAPCDLYKVADYRTLGGSGHTVLYSSNVPVRTPSGDCYVTFQFTHDYNPPLTQNVSQGEVIYHSGAQGGAYGIHLHLDQSLVQNDSWVSYGYRCYGESTNCWALKNSVKPDQVFYVNDTTLTTAGSFSWKMYEGGTVKTYDLTVVNGNGSVQGKSEGDVVDISAIVPKGKKFNGWTLEGSGKIANKNLLKTTFTFGSSSATVTANLIDKKSSNWVPYAQAPIYRKH